MAPYCIERHLLKYITIPFFVILYLNIEKLAERHGWDGLLSWLWELYTPTPYKYLTQPWALNIAIAVVAFAAGFWLDNIVRKSELKKQTFDIDRRELANTADKLAEKISALIAEFEAERIKAWQEVRATTWTGGEYPHSDRETNAEIRMVERYNERYNSDVLQLLEKADLAVHLDKTIGWQIRRDGVGRSDISQLPLLLTKISVALQDPSNVKQNVSSVPPEHRLSGSKRAVR